jgi:Zn-finger domain-containing protein
MVFKDKDAAAVRWELRPRFYSKTEERILTIIKQAHSVINNSERKLAYKVGYLEECLNSIEESIKEDETYKGTDF